jgi:hypothetical protein
MMPFMESIDSNKWRWEKYICEDVDLTLKSYLPILKAVYGQFSGRKTKPGMKPFMSLDEFEDLVIQAGFVNDIFV